MIKKQIYIKGQKLLNKRTNISAYLMHEYGFYHQKHDFWREKRSESLADDQPDASPRERTYPCR